METLCTATELIVWCLFFARGQVNMMFDAHSARVARWEEHGHRLGVRLVKATTHREAQALIQAGKPTFSLPPHETS